ncbi:hypothetical protein Tco_0344661 [Tanacetum coccineum]
MSENRTYSSHLCFAPKDFNLLLTQEKQCEKPLTILLSAIPEDSFSFFHDAVDARSLWKAIKQDLEETKHQRRCKVIFHSEDANLKFLNEIICSFFAQQASMPTTHDDEDLLQIDEDAMEEIDIRWQVAMITARIGSYEEDRKIH